MARNKARNAFSIGDYSVSNELLTKTVSFLQTSEGPWHACVKATGKRELDVRVEGNGNARIFFKSLFKPVYCEKKNYASYLEKILKEPSLWKRSL